MFVFGFFVAMRARLQKVFCAAHFQFAFFHDFTVHKYHTKTKGVERESLRIIWINFACCLMCAVCCVCVLCISRVWHGNYNSCVVLCWGRFQVNVVNVCERLHTIAGCVDVYHF